ncbi:MAG: polysulfide reductase NrfD [Leptospiraceae bacterium]|nr:polysulfide reductase NrfD [Leptospiraceae bacterium]MCB1199349.1 polysulfide reductase NrfD [Leptospiraceae bacterium]
MSLESVKNPFHIGKTFKQIDDDIMRPMETFPSKTWWIAFLIAASLLAMFAGILIYSFVKGLGIFGLNNPVGWGLYIVNFVFWVGIGHAGTLISAILFLFRQRWRTSINRAAEAMTIFAVMVAAIFPLIHVGRPWFVFWVFPYPNERGPLWVNWRSPLLWDVFAISTYFIISLQFWYMGLVPDFANMRDRQERFKARSKIGELLLTVKKITLRVISLGWVGSAKTWHHYEKMVLILSALATPLVLSVHTIVSFDFATSIIPGWHATIFPPYFVAGAIYSGFAMVLTLMIIMRRTFKLEDYITMKHLENIGLVILVTGMMVSYAYTVEFVIAAYSANKVEQYVFMNRLAGPYAWAFWTMFACNVVSPHFMWFKKLRNNLTVLFIISIVVNIGMWFERFVIVVTSLHRDYLPSSWDMYVPTIYDWGMMLGSFGVFFTFFLLFVRTLPVIAIAEVKADEANDSLHAAH